jgi:hypothetical protein
MTHYGVDGHFSALYETFQGGHVERYEDFEVFCARQEVLYRRLFPDAPESRLVSELVKQLNTTNRTEGNKVNQFSGNWRRTGQSPSRSASAE